MPRNPIMDEVRDLTWRSSVHRESVRNQFAVALDLARMAGATTRNPGRLDLTTPDILEERIFRRANSEMQYNREVASMLRTLRNPSFTSVHELHQALPQPRSIDLLFQEDSPPLPASASSLSPIPPCLPPIPPCLPSIPPLPSIPLLPSLRDQCESVARDYLETIPPALLTASHSAYGALSEPVDYSAETISPSIATPVDFTLEGDPRVELTNELAMEEANATELPNVSLSSLSVLPSASSTSTVEYLEPMTLAQRNVEDLSIPSATSIIQSPQSTLHRPPLKGGKKYNITEPNAISVPAPLSPSTIAECIISDAHPGNGPSGSAADTTDGMAEAQRHRPTSSSDPPIRIDRSAAATNRGSILKNFFDSLFSGSRENSPERRARDAALPTLTEPEVLASSSRVSDALPVSVASSVGVAPPVCEALPVSEALPVIEGRAASVAAPVPEPHRMVFSLREREPLRLNSFGSSQSASGSGPIDPCRMGRKEEPLVGRKNLRPRLRQSFLSHIQRHTEPRTSSPQPPTSTDGPRTAHTDLLLSESWSDGLTWRGPDSDQDLIPTVTLDTDPCTDPSPVPPVSTSTQPDVITTMADSTPALPRIPVRVSARANLRPDSPSFLSQLDETHTRIEAAIASIDDALEAPPSSRSVVDDGWRAVNEGWRMMDDLRSGENDQCVLRRRRERRRATRNQIAQNALDSLAPESLHDSWLFGLNHPISSRIPRPAPPVAASAAKRDNAAIANAATSALINAASSSRPTQSAPAAEDETTGDVDMRQEPAASTPRVTSQVTSDRPRTEESATVGSGSGDVDMRQRNFVPFVVEDFLNWRRRLGNGDRAAGVDLRERRGADQSATFTMPSTSDGTPANVLPAVNSAAVNSLAPASRVTFSSSSGQGVAAHQPTHLAAPVPGPQNSTNGRASIVESTAASEPDPVHLVEGSVLNQVFDHFSCMVCLTKANDPRMCSKCTKFICLFCLQQTYQRCPGGRRCPHCRAHLRQDQYIRVTWAEDLTDKLQAIQTSDKCPDHVTEQLTLFCVQCQKSICSDCWLQEHQDHKISPLKAIHDQHKNEIKDKVAQLKDQEKRVKEYLILAQNALMSLNTNKVEAENLINKAGRDMLAAVDLELEAKLRPVNAELANLRQIADIMKRSITEGEALLVQPMVNRAVDTQGAFLKGSKGLTPDQEAQIERMKFNKEDVPLGSLTFKKQMTPDWDVQKDVVVKDFQRLVAERGVKMTVMNYNGISWHVGVGVDSKAGPATHDDESGETDETPADAVRIFVVMAGRPSLKNYEFQVDLPKIGAAWSRSHNVIRWDSFKQFERIYIPIHNTQQWVREDGSLAFKFKVRPCTYQQQSLDQRIFIEHLSARLPMDGKDEMVSTTAAPQSLAPGSSNLSRSRSVWLDLNPLSPPWVPTPGPGYLTLPFVTVPSSSSNPSDATVTGEAPVPRAPRTATGTGDENGDEEEAIYGVGHQRTAQEVAPPQQQEMQQDDQETGEFCPPKKRKKIDD